VNAALDLSPPPTLSLNDAREFRRCAIANGYRLVRVRTQHKRPLTRDWQNGDRPDLLLSVHPDAANTGLLLAGLRCVDIDVDDPQLVMEIVKAAHIYLPQGALIRRRVDSPRIALLYRAAEGQPPKRVVAGPKGKIEILGCGQQVVVHGLHPSGAPYNWLKAQGPHTVPYDQLAGIREEQIEAFLKACSSLLGATPQPQLVSSQRSLAVFPTRQPITPNELSAGVERPKAPPVDLNIVATECGFIREALTSGGNSYDNSLWNLTTLIATFAENGRAMAHVMANKHPTYTQESTDDLFDRKEREKAAKNLGWPSCETISGHGCASCSACAHLVKGKSRLHLAARGLAPRKDNSCTVKADPLDFVETTLEDAVDRINNEYFFRRDTSEICRQCAETGEIQVLTAQQFNTALAGRWVETLDPKAGKPKMREAAKVWLESRARREVHGVQYCPNNVGLRQGHLNLFLGFGCEPVPGDGSLVVDHIHHNIASGDDAKADFVLNWCADILQKPARKPGVALVLRGSEGTGKSVLGAILRQVLGPRNVLVNADKDRLLGRFNSALAGKLLIQAEESFFAGDARTTDALKHLITGQTLEIELKFGRSFEIESFHRLLITSNHAQVIQASSEARRFVVCDVTSSRRGDTAYFDRLYAVADGRDEVTARAFMHHLLSRDLSKFRPWEAQQQFLGDKALIDQKLLSLTPPLTWLQEVFERVESRPPAAQGYWDKGLPVDMGWPSTLPRSGAVENFREWAAVAKPHGASTYTGSKQRFWSEITKVIPLDRTRVKDSNPSSTVRAGSREISH
jgi:Family of unknown function (DUF5906)/Bifunctional DNA primase/polymerase, N-terminal